MNDIIFASGKAIYLTMLLSAGPVMVATIVGLLVGLIQTVTQLQEQTLPFGLKLLAVSLCLFLLSGWAGDLLLEYGREVVAMALRKA